MIDIQLGYTQRYFHFVALQGNIAILDQAFFRTWKIKRDSSHTVGSNTIISHFSMKSKFQYYKGDINNPNKPIEDPLKYDVIIIEHRSTNTLVLGFPFKKQAVELVNSLVNTYSVLSNSNFVKVDMSKLIKANNKHTDIYHNHNHYWLGGVFINISGDSFLSTVKLAGDKPLESDIYKSYFKEKLSRKDQKNGLEKCILKSKIVAEKDDSSYTVSSSLNIDKFGNYKIYLHSKGRNLLSIPATLDFLQSEDCLTYTPNNPVQFIKNEEI